MAVVLNGHGLGTPEGSDAVSSLIDSSCIEDGRRHKFARTSLGKGVPSKRPSWYHLSFLQTLFVSLRSQPALTTTYWIWACADAAWEEISLQFKLATRTALASIMINLANLCCYSSEGTQSMPPPELPRLVAEQATPIPSHDKDTQRLIVVLSNATIETFKSSARDDKYTLLNSDEHIGIMRKMNRDISEARPDIVHQV